jgi:hypothetical protein
VPGGGWIDAFMPRHALSEVALFRKALCGRRRLQGLCPRTPRIYRLVPLPMLGSLRETDERGPKHPPYRSVEATESALGLLPIALSAAQFGLIVLRRDKEAHLCGGF